MGRRGQEGIATEAEPIDCEKGGQGFFKMRISVLKKEKIDLAAIALADPAPKDSASDCGEIASVI
jgi:hypothetical protein